MQNRVNHEDPDGVYGHDRTADKVTIPLLPWSELNLTLRIVDSVIAAITLILVRYCLPISQSPSSPKPYYLIKLLTMGSTLAYLSTLLILSKGIVISYSYSRKTCEIESIIYTVYFSSMLATLNRRGRLRKQIAVGNGALLFPPSGMVGIGSASYQGFLRAQPPVCSPT